MRPRIFASFAITVVVLVWYCSAAPHKRPPSNIGFVGTRGKRSVTPDEDSEKDKRAPTGFVGLRGKKPSPAADSSFPIAAMYPEEAIYKRVPSGFLGVRGKKEGFDDRDNYYVESYYKRAPSGFIGMRGRRDDMYEPFEEKRKAPAGFIGMRGKKDFDTTDFDVKRVPSFGFFGTRGKKLSRSGFFGTRGKKYPYQFRGKFVGVRGKKASNDVNGADYYDDDELERLTQELDWNQLMLLLTASGDSNGFASNDPQHMK